MKKRTYLLAFWGILLLSNCSQHVDETLDVPTVKIDINNVSTLNMEDIASFAGIIPLETTDHNLIGEIKKVFLTDSHIIIWDSKTSNVLLFDQDGSFQYNIGRKGGSVKEYIEITDVYFDKELKCIYILDISSKKIMSYDIEGRYLNHYPINYYLYSFLPTDNGYWGTNSYQNSKRYDLIFLDMNSMEITQGYFPCKHDLILLRSNNFAKDEITNEILYHYSYSDMLYKIEDQEVVPFLYFDFGKKKNSYDINSKEFLDKFDNLEYVGRIKNVHLHNNALFFSFSHNYGYNGESKPYYGYMHLDELNPIIYQLDVKYSSQLKVQPLPEIIGLSEGKLIYQIIPGILPEELISKAFNDINSKYKITTDSNPVLVFYDLNK